MQKFIIGMLVLNKAGVLTRISGMFARRGFNIDSLAVGETENPKFSRITVTMTGDSYARDQIMKQLTKLHDVKKVKEMNAETSVSRELVIVKIATNSENRQEIMDAVSVFRNKIIDFAPKSICVEATGETSKLDAFIELMKPYGVLEMCRTGVVSLERGSTCIKDGDTIINQFVSKETN